MKSRVLRALCAAAIALTVAGAVADDAGACSCAYATAREKLSGSDAAMVARVQAKEPILALDIPTVRLTLRRIGPALKGRVGRIIRMDTPIEGGACGMGFLPRGRVIGVALYRGPAGWTSSLCSLESAVRLRAAARSAAQPRVHTRTASRAISLSGRGWAPRRMVALYVGRRGSRVRRVLAVRTNCAGRFSVSLPRAPDMSAGRYDLVARQGRGGTRAASSSFRLGDP
jgi:hypothetical protein